MEVETLACRCDTYYAPCMQQRYSSTGKTRLVAAASHLQRLPGCSVFQAAAAPHLQRLPGCPSPVRRVARARGGKRKSCSHRPPATHCRRGRDHEQNSPDQAAASREPHPPVLLVSHAPASALAARRGSRRYRRRAAACGGGAAAWGCSCLYAPSDCCVLAVRAPTAASETCRSTCQ